MELLLISIVIGLSLLSSDVTAAAALSQQQQQFLRQWLMRNQNVSHVRVVWQPAAAPSVNARAHTPRNPVTVNERPRLQRRRIQRQRMLKAGYAIQQQPAAPQPRVYVFNSPAAPRAAKPARQAPYWWPAAPQSKESYNPTATSYRSQAAERSSSQFKTSHSVPAPQPELAVQSSYRMSQASEAEPGASYRVIYIQPPDPRNGRAKPASPPAKPPAAPPHAPSSQSGHKPAAATAAAAASAPAPAAVHASAPAAQSAAQPQTLFIVMPSSSSSSSAMTSVNTAGGAAAHLLTSYSLPSLPACPPAPGKHTDSMASYTWLIIERHFNFNWDIEATNSIRLQ